MDQVKQSFLQEYPIEVMRNKIDTKTFKFTESDLRDKLDIRNKYVILGVASKWTCRKGVNDFFKLATLLDHRFKIIMVGLTQSQMKRSPKEIIGIQHTEDAKQLAQFYSMADVFINLTYEENYPTVNLEAEACGTPVITYDTGGCKETLMRKESKVVETGKLSEIIRLLENKYSENNEIRRGTTLE